MTRPPARSGITAGSGADGDDLQIRAGRRDRTVGASVPAAHHVREVTLERVASRIIERLQRQFDGAEVAAVERSERLRRAISEHMLALGDLDPVDSISEELTDPRTPAPCRRRVWGRQRRRMVGEDAEHLPHHPVRRPRCDPDAATRPAHAEQLGGRSLLVGGEHHAEDRDDRIERRVVEGQGAGVGLAELDRESIALRPRPRALQQARSEVDPHDLTVAARRRDRGVPRAGRDVEYARATGEVQPFDQAFGDRDDLCAHGRVVARAPHPDRLRGPLIPRLDHRPTPTGVTIG